MRSMLVIYSKSQAYNKLYTWHLGANADCFFITNCLKSQGSKQVLILALGGECVFDPKNTQGKATKYSMEYKSPGLSSQDKQALGGYEVKVFFIFKDPVYL